MSRQQAPKTSHPVKGQPTEEEDVYEQLEMQEERFQYMTTIHPNHVEDNSQLAGQISTKVKRWKCVVIALMTVFLVIALVVSLVAVIIYSPLVSGGDKTESRIQQLEAMLQGTNHSFKESLESLEAQVQQQSDYDSTVSSQFLNVQNSVQNLSLVQNNIRQDLNHLWTIQGATNHSFISLKESLESLQTKLQQQSNYDDTVSSQFLIVQNSVQNLSLVQNNIRQDLNHLWTIQGATNHSFISLKESLESLQTKLQQQSDYDDTVSSQFLLVQNSVQNLSLVQNNIRQDLDRLRTINLYKGCINETRTCSLSTGLLFRYWITCSTGSISINPEVSFSIPGPHHYNYVYNL